MKATVITLLSIVLLAGCSSSYQAVQQNNASNNDTSVALPYGETTKARNITSIKGYQPTEDDVIRYKNDVQAFLEANVPNFSKYRDAIIVIDDLKADSVNQVSLNDIKLISVLDPSSTSVLGTAAAGGAIVIKTK